MSNHTYKAVLSPHTERRGSEEDDESVHDCKLNGDKIEEEDDLEELSCSQYAKGYSEQEDMQSSSRFDSDYIQNVLQEGLKNSGIKSTLQSDFDDQLSHQVGNSTFGNLEEFSRTNYTYHHNASQKEVSEEYFSMKRENKLLKEKLCLIQQEIMERGEFVRTQLEYLQATHEHQQKELLKSCMERYEGKLSHCTEQIKMYQMSIENIRLEYQEKNQRLYESVMRLENEKQELIEKNIILLKSKIQNRPVDDNGDDSQCNKYNYVSSCNNSTPQQPSLTLYNSKYNATPEGNQYNSLPIHSSLTPVGVDLLNSLRFTGSFSQQLASMRQDCKDVQSKQGSREKLIDLQVENIKYAPMNRTLEQSIYGMTRPLSEYDTTIKSISNTQQLAHISKQIDTDSFDSSFHGFQIRGHQTISDSETIATNKSFSLDRPKRKSFLSIDANRGSHSSQIDSPRSIVRCTPVFQPRSKVFIDQKSVSVDTRRKSGQMGEQNSSLSRIKAYQDSLLNESVILKRRNTSNVYSRKNSVNESLELGSANPSHRIQLLKNERTLKTSSDLSKVERNHSLSTLYSQKENRDKQKEKYKEQDRKNRYINCNSYMKDTHSSKQKNIAYQIQEGPSSLVRSSLQNPNKNIILQPNNNLLNKQKNTVLHY